MLAKHMLRLFLGIIMGGGMLSPIMAMHVAAEFEHKWHSGLGNIFNGVRKSLPLQPESPQSLCNVA